MADMIEMKTLTIDDVTYEIVDEYARSHVNIFVATYGVTTSAELEAAYNNNKLVLCIYNNGVYMLTTRFSDTKHSFDSIYKHSTWNIIVENDVWDAAVEHSFAYNDHDHRFSDNVTGGSANDTVAFWIEKGPGYCWISETDQVVNQPHQYGFLISYANDGDVFQIFRDQTEGATYHRSGDDVNGWFDHWTRVVTTDYFPTELEEALTNSPNITIKRDGGIIKIESADGTKYFSMSEGGYVVVEDSKIASLMYNSLQFVGTEGTITGLGAPTEDNHAANKKYVDDLISASITGAIEGSY